jgi:hypothetical protein
MKKYRLIREYPDSPEVDTEIIKSDISNSSLGSYDTYMIKGEKWFKLSNPQDYPEFWEPVVEKNYEILSFKVSNGYLYNKINNSDDYLLEENVCDGETNTYNNMINNINYKIHSIKRLSDSEIFTIEDKIDCKGWFGNIVKFEISNNELKIFQQQHVDSSSYTPLLIQELNKVKKPLFTTKDGVDIFEINKDWGVALKDGEESTITSDYNWKAFDLELWNEKSYNCEYWKLFSTKEKAEEYILMNKPCLSFNDIKTIFKKMNKINTDNLTELIKTKINK